MTVSFGKGYDVIMDLIQPYSFQGYEVYCNNFDTNHFTTKYLEQEQYKKKKMFQLKLLV